MENLFEQETGFLLVSVRGVAGGGGGGGGSSRGSEEPPFLEFNVHEL